MSASITTAWQRRRHPTVEGALDAIPLSLAIIPFAFTVGTVIASADVDPIGAWAGSFLLFGGAAQLAAIELVDSGGGVWVAAATAVAINARFFVYTPGLARWFATESRFVRALLAIPIVDQSYLVCASRFDRGDLDARGRRGYYLGVVVPPSIVWVASQAVGIHLRVPGADALAIAPALLFAGLLVSTVTTRAAARTACVAAAVTLAATPPLGAAALGVGILTAALIGAGR